MRGGQSTGKPETELYLGSERLLGPADELQVRLLLRMPPAERIRSMLTLQEVFLRTWGERLRRAHPEISDPELCQMMFERLAQNG